MTRHRIIAKCYDKKNRLLSSAENDYDKSHPLQKTYAAKAGMPYKEFLHAEILAIIRAKKPIHRISVARLNRQGKMRLAKPCEICQLAIEEAGIRLVEYTL